MTDNIYSAFRTRDDNPWMIIFQWLLFAPVALSKNRRIARNMEESENRKIGKSENWRNRGNLSLLFYYSTLLETTHHWHHWSNVRVLLCSVSLAHGVCLFQLIQRFQQGFPDFMKYRYIRRDWIAMYNLGLVPSCMTAVMTKHINKSLHKCID